MTEDRHRDAARGERVERTFRCPSDGRVIAQIVARNAERILRVVGGKFGHTATLRRSLMELEDRLRSGTDTSILSGLMPDTARRLVDRVRDEPVEVEPEEYSLPPYVKLLAGPRRGESY